VGLISSFGISTQSSVPHFFHRNLTSRSGRLGNGYTSDYFVAPESGDIYFYSPEVLEAGRGVSGQQNLYVYHDGSVQFVATLLPPGTTCEASGGGTQAPACSETTIGRIEVSPDGRFAAFVASAKLTDYDNDGRSMMYRYDAELDELTCVSCLPSGALPQHEVYGSMNGLFMTDDGRVFFATKDAVVPRDTNAATDVYEYVQSRPQLITPGTTSGENESVFGLTPFLRSGLVGVSANGLDAYVAVYDRLTIQDENGKSLKIYDARTGGGFPVSPPPSPCAAADECHGPSSTPAAPITAGSVGQLGGGGNLPPKRCVRKKFRAQKKANRRKPPKRCHPDRRSAK
jgi:hypothetical protein